MSSNDTKKEQNVWVAYITSSCDYDFETNIVGIFRSERSALLGVFDALANEYKIFSFRDDDEDRMKKYQKVTNEIYSKITAKNIRKFLLQIVRKENDSYFKQVWTYSVKPFVIKE